MDGARERGRSESIPLERFPDSIFGNNNPETRRRQKSLATDPDIPDLVNVLFTRHVTFCGNKPQVKHITFDGYLTFCL